MFFVITAIIAAVICVASLIVGPRLKDTSSAGFKACVAVSAISLLTAAGTGFVAFTTFDVGDPDAIKPVEIDEVYDLWLPQDGSPLVIDSAPNEEGEWCYVIHTIDLSVEPWVENLRYVPADTVHFLDTGDDGHSYMEWTETFLVYGDEEFHNNADAFKKMGLRNGDEMVSRAESLVAPANCVVYIPRGTIVNHPPENGQQQPAGGDQPPQETQLSEDSGQPEPTFEPQDGE